VRHQSNELLIGRTRITRHHNIIQQTDKNSSRRATNPLTSYGSGRATLGSNKLTRVSNNLVELAKAPNAFQAVTSTPSARGNSFGISSLSCLTAPTSTMPGVNIVSAVESVRRSRLVLYVGALVAAVVMSLCASPSIANAQATVDHITQISAQREEIYVQSPAMQRIVQLDVLLPADQGVSSRPTLYLLDGNGASDTEGESTWSKRGGAVQFFADKPVNVVMPVGGPGSFYTDWEKDDPKLGHNRWETFLTVELPPLVNGLLKNNGVNAIGGVSMGAQAAATLTVRNPSLYQALATFSGCLYSSNLGQLSVRPVVIADGGNPDNMWGPADDPQWKAHDPSAHLDQLRGKPVFVYTGTGVAGPDDVSFDPSFSYPATLTEAIALEQGAHDCTVSILAAMDLVGLHPEVDWNAIGTHSWPYWKEALPKSWPTLKTGLGV
jgi:S-formylglutathione hydrolase FrmB